MKLEDQLRNALRREDPPEGFAERVIQQAGPVRAQLRQASPKRGFWRASPWLWPAVAAMAATLVLSVSIQYRRAQEERAGKQAIYALQIVAEELNMARSEVLDK
jgi:anti-sigma-K factor RskA